MSGTSGLVGVAYPTSSTCDAVGYNSSSTEGVVATIATNLAGNDVADTCSTLGAFVYEVRAQSGKDIPRASAVRFIVDAQRIEAILAC